MKHKNELTGKLINNSNITLGIVLGSGVEINEDLYSHKKILFEDSGGIHHKQIFKCNIAGSDVLVFKGRRHFYEGHSLNEITSNIRLTRDMNVRNLLITNAAGGVNDNFTEGDLMLINSHINFIGKIRLKKTTFPYSISLAEKFRRVCGAKRVKLHEGVYACYPGPVYETGSEVRMQKKFMIDAAGMSTVPEVLEAVSSGMIVIAVSVITNLLKESPVGQTSHSDVLAVAKLASARLNLVLPELISELN